MVLELGPKKGIHIILPIPLGLIECWEIESKWRHITLLQKCLIVRLEETEVRILSSSYLNLQQFNVSTTLSFSLNIKLSCSFSLIGIGRISPSCQLLFRKRYNNDGQKVIFLAVSDDSSWLKVKTTRNPRFYICGQLTLHIVLGLLSILKKWNFYWLPPPIACWLFT